MTIWSIQLTNYLNERLLKLTKIEKKNCVLFISDFYDVFIILSKTFFFNFIFLRPKIIYKNQSSKHIKYLTFCIANLRCKYCLQNNMNNEKQKDCIRRSFGCIDQLKIASIIIKEAYTNKKKNFVGCIERNLLLHDFF